MSDDEGAHIKATPYQCAVAIALVARLQRTVQKSVGPALLDAIGAVEWKTTSKIASTVTEA